MQGTPKLLYADCGTENRVLAFLHPFLRQAEKTFRYVRSVANQGGKYVDFGNLRSIHLHRQLRLFGQYSDGGVQNGGLTSLTAWSMKDSMKNVILFIGKDKQIA